MPSPDSSDYANNKEQNVSAYGSSQTETGRASLSLNLGFLKNLTEKKRAKGDGEPPKKRGPKPDSKPALTRRQELNRQAQRTHRERKELYIKALEQEVLRLKENFSVISRDKDAIEEENRQLKALLARYGIPWTGTDVFDEYTRKVSVSNLTGGSNSGSFAPGSQSYSTPPLNSPLTSNNLSTSPPEFGSNLGGLDVIQNQKAMDYDQVGIDFVLTLERPCMDHMQFLIERAIEPEGGPCGHALMASCPPDPYVEPHPDSPFKHYHSEKNNNGQKSWDISKSDLANLLDLSKRLNLDGEITPVIAWGMIMSDTRFPQMTREHIESICQLLSGKIRCYGFGAVLEEFEVRDALESIVFDEK